MSANTYRRCRAALAVAAVVLAVAGAAVNLTSWCAPSALSGACGAGQDNAEALARALREQIAWNPAAAEAYIRLLVVSTDAQLPAAVRAAGRLAPNDPNVLLTRARLALTAGRVREAVPDLVQLSEHHHEQVPQATQALVRLIEAGEIESLRMHLKPGSRWLGLVLLAMAEAQLPLVRASALIAQGGQIGALSPERMTDLMSRLKSSGDWVDAYGLWIAQQGRQAPVLFNGDFDQPFVHGGFDWEIHEGPSGRAGVQVSRRRFPARATVLELQFTGKSVQGVPVRQLLFLGPGVYRMSGDYRTENLRTEQGLAWAARCMSNERPMVGRSPPLTDSKANWSRFEFEIVVPPGCGPVTSLQLETVAPFEAAAGLRGRVFFDNFTLVSAD